MKKILCYITIIALALSCIKMPGTGKQNGGGNGNGNTETPATTDKQADITYQLLIYSFADSDGDGVGDFKGIQNKLDYLSSLGVSALWLSPAHPTSSYHAYDVNDYYSLNPLYAVGQKTTEKAEADFKDLLAAAHQKGIAIYMDYVLNHSGKHNPWFQEAISDPSSKYRDYYFISSNPSTEYKNFPMLKGTSYNSGEWKQVTSGSPKLKVSKTTESVTNGTDSWNMYMWQDGVGDKTVKFVNKGDGTYYLVMEINGTWGMLVRKYPNWDAGSKFGAKTATTIQEGTAVELVAYGADMFFTGSGRYKLELTDVSTETLYYMGCFSDWMPDLNYGDVSVAENNACFQDLAASADKWINMGVDGFRLDAVKHICGGIGSYNNTSNITLLGKWYDHCNATYKAAGHTDNIFMVAEAWDGHNIEKTYYKGLTSCFEFDFGYKLRDAIKGANASGFASAVGTYVSDHTAQRSDAITSFFLSNHDQNRFATEIGGKNADKQKLAAAVLLTIPGKPFIYQGEELGYWGSKDGGDEYVRTPILWDKAGTQCAKAGVNDKVDNSMLTADISVEAQEANNASILSVYRKFAAARNSSKALAKGTIKEVSSGNNSIALWEMSCGGEKVLVAHNFGGGTLNVTLSGYSTENELVSNGTIGKTGNGITMGPYSSVVFKQ